MRAVPKYGGRDGLAVDGDVGLVEVDAALAVHEEGELAGLDLVLALAPLVEVLQGALDGGEPVAGGGDGVDEAVAGGVLVVVQVALGADASGTGVEGVDEHVGDGDGAGDLDAGPPQVLGDGRDLPVAGVGLGLWQVGRKLALGQGPVEHVDALPPQVMNGGGEPVVEGHQVLDEVVCE